MFKLFVDSTVGSHFNDLDLHSRSRWYEYPKLAMVDYVEEKTTGKSDNGLVDRNCLDFWSLCVL